MFVTKHLDAVLQGGDWTSCLRSSNSSYPVRLTATRVLEVPHRHKRDWKKTNHNPSVLAPYRGLPSQYLSILLVRSYRTFAPLPITVRAFREKPLHNWRYFSVALSSRSLALGIIQQVWSFGSPDFPQICLQGQICNHLANSLIYLVYY